VHPLPVQDTLAGQLFAFVVVAADLPAAPSSALAASVACAPLAPQTYGWMGFYVGGDFKEGKDART
jgi:hypothetical protein